MPAGPTLADQLVAGRSEGPFDRQADLLHGLVGGDLALVTVRQDGRQHNVGIGPDASAVPRDVDDTLSLCTYTMRRDAVVVVPDMHEHAELASHPACRDLGLRSYLAAPFHVVGVGVVGTVCVVGAQPAAWSAADVAALVALRDHVEGLVQGTVDDLSGLGDLGPALRHELGGDLSVVLSGVETALLPVDDEVRATVLRRALRHARRLATVLDALLALGAGPPSQVESVELTPVLRGIAPRGSGRVSYDVADGLVLRVEGTLLERLVTNLVENALKHTDGEVRLRAAPLPDGGVVLAVADDGDGLPVGADVFEAFVRGDGDREGFGFGLHLVRRLALRLGAGVDVDTGPDGTTFTVRLPPAPPLG